MYDNNSDDRFTDLTVEPDYENSRRVIVYIARLFHIFLFNTIIFFKRL